MSTNHPISIDKTHRLTQTLLYMRQAVVAYTHAHTQTQKRPCGKYTVLVGET